MRESLLRDILRLEWEMFERVPNAGGKAACQSDPATFAVMRSSQAETWPDNVLESWLADLEEAKGEGRNLMSEKYAWMMENTFPDEYAELADMLPRPEGGTLELIEEIVAVNVAWKRETAACYPLLGESGRAVRSWEDSPWDTSFETYLRGELKTYSAETVRRLYGHTQNLLEAGLNGVEQILSRQVRKYGYATLMAAEASQAERK